jgi:hypothetical protein
MFKRSFFYLFLLFSLSILDVGESNEQPNADDIFKAYTHTVELQNTRIAFNAETFEIYEGAYNWEVQPKTRKNIATIWTDNGRASVKFTESFTHVGEVDKRRAIKRTMQVRYANGEKITAQTVNDHLMKFVSIVDGFPDDYKPSLDLYLLSGRFMDGDAACKTRSLPEIMREGSIHLRDKMEIVDGHKTYVLEAENQYGKQILWIDPEFGCNPRRIIMHTEADDLHADDKPLGISPSKSPDGITKTPWVAKYLEEIIVESIEIDNINGVFLPTSAVILSTTTYSTGEVTKIRATHKRTNTNLNPDFDAMGAFELDIPDGVPVFFYGTREGSGIQYEWFDGKPRINIDELFLDSLDNQIDQLNVESGTKVPANEKPEIYSNELPATGDAQVSIVEEETAVVSVSRPSHLLVLISVGLVIVCVIAWQVRRRLKT